MLAVKIIAIVLGLAFTLFGYFIFFRKKHSLINDFREDHEAGRKTADDARRIGMIEFVAGVVLLTAAVILLIWA